MILPSVLKAQTTRDDPQERYHWKTRLVRGLYERGWRAEQVRQLFRLIDWLMALPAALQTHFREELYTYEEEKHMPYLSSFEREALEKGQQEGLHKGLLRGLELALVAKFGEEGRKLLPRLRAIKDPDKLEAIAQAFETAESAAALRPLLR
jgi:hypothetical protein